MNPFDNRIWTHDGRRPLEAFAVFRQAGHEVRTKAGMGDWSVSRAVALMADVPDQPSYGSAPAATTEAIVVHLVAGLDIAGKMRPSERVIYARFATEEDQQAFASWLFR
jgi:hypothetical protein